MLIVSRNVDVEVLRDSIYSTNHCSLTPEHKFDMCYTHTVAYGYGIRLSGVSTAKRVIKIDNCQRQKTILSQHPNRKHNTQYESFSLV